MNAPQEPPALALQRGARQTLSEQLCASFAQRIRSGDLASGARLPSVRDCARAQRLSPSTVVAAYDRLQAQGLVQARQQRGYFVRDAAAQVATAERAPLPAAPALAAPVDATALIRGMFQGAEGQPIPAGPGMGTLPEAWLDQPLLDRALRRAMAGPSQALRYGEPAGDPGLRQALARRLSADLGIAAEPAQIVTTLGATHALDLVARSLLQPGDAVLVDDPGWAMEFARLGRMGMRLLPVPRDANGPDLERMQALLAEHRPRVYVTVSVLHNPTGHSLSLATAHRILQLAEAHDLMIVEDDTYAWLAPGHSPRLCALDGLRRTVYVSGFSKILAPNWRVGYLAAAPALAQRCIDTKLLTTLTTPALLEQAVAWCLDQGLLRRHAERVVQRLALARSRVRRLAESAGCRFVAPPQGLFGWVDCGVDADVLASRLAERGWLVAPGSLFHARPQPSTLMRLNFASAQQLEFWRAFAAVRDTLAPPGSGLANVGGQR